MLASGGYVSSTSLEILVSFSFPSLCVCPQSIPPTAADLEAVVREDSPEVLREACPPDLTSVDEKDVSYFSPLPLLLNYGGTSLIIIGPPFLSPSLHAIPPSTHTRTLN